MGVRYISGVRWGTMALLVAIPGAVVLLGALACLWCLAFPSVRTKRQLVKGRDGRMVEEGKEEGKEEEALTLFSTYTGRQRTSSGEKGPVSPAAAAALAARVAKRARKRDRDAALRPSGTADSGGDSSGARSGPLYAWAKQFSAQAVVLSTESGAFLLEAGRRAKQGRDRANADGAVADGGGGGERGRKGRSRSREAKGRSRSRDAKDKGGGIRGSDGGVELQATTTKRTPKVALGMPLGSRLGEPLGEPLGGSGLGGIVDVNIDSFLNDYGDGGNAYGASGGDLAPTITTVTAAEAATAARAAAAERSGSGASSSSSSSIQGWGSLGSGVASALAATLGGGGGSVGGGEESGNGGVGARLASLEALAASVGAHQAQLAHALSGQAAKDRSAIGELQRLDTVARQPGQGQLRAGIAAGREEELAAALGRTGGGARAMASAAHGPGGGAWGDLDEWSERLAAQGFDGVPVQGDGGGGGGSRQPLPPPSSPSLRRPSSPGAPALSKLAERVVEGQRRARGRSGGSSEERRPSSTGPSSQPNSRPSSRPNSRPSSRSNSRPSSRPTTPNRSRTSSGGGGGAADLPAGIAHMRPSDAASILNASATAASTLEAELGADNGGVGGGGGGGWGFGLGGVLAAVGDGLAETFRVPEVTSDPPPRAVPSRSDSRPPRPDDSYPEAVL